MMRADVSAILYAGEGKRGLTDENELGHQCQIAFTIC